MDLVLEKSISINATAAKVWQTLTDGDQLKQVYYGCDVITDWKVGSAILFKGSWDGTDFTDKGTIRSFEDGKWYEYDYWSNFSGLPDLPENHSLIRFEVEAAGDKSLLKLRHSNFPTQTQYEHSDENWNSSLELIKKLSEQ